MQKRLFNNFLGKPIRQKLRNNSTLAERKLWCYLSRRQILGHKFRRQVSVGRYVVDFYCYQLKLAIEVDGDAHFTLEAQEYDVERQFYIESFGVKFLRFTNDEVFNNIEGVLGKIIDYIDPSPRAKF
ncbi:MAG: endonuclease domain-containing protein [Candidatus Buchananbacteria bacterium]|nr:endonuclease domain-containing protein [Candidatus Buchananbacteria bacterium]